MPDDLFLYTAGVLVILAQQVWAALGWACPVLVDKS